MATDYDKFLLDVRMARGDALYDRNKGWQQSRDGVMSTGYSTGNVAGTYTRDATNAAMGDVNRRYAQAMQQIEAQVAAYRRRGSGQKKPIADPTPPGSGPAPTTSYQYAVENNNIPVEAQAMYTGAPRPGTSYAAPVYSPPSNYSQYSPYNPAPARTPAGGSSAQDRPRYSRY